MIEYFKVEARTIECVFEKYIIVIQRPNSMSCEGCCKIKSKMAAATTHKRLPRESQRNIAIAL